MKRILTMIAAMIAALSLFVGTSPVFASYQYDWPGYPQDGVTGTYSISGGAVQAGFAACDDYTTYVLNGSTVPDTFSSQSQGQFLNGTALETWCNVYVSDPSGAGWCYSRWQVWNNNVKQGWWGSTPPPICTQYSS